LIEDSSIDAPEITIAVARGEVTLEGTVPDRESKRRADGIGGDFPGVAHVHNRLRIVTPPVSSSRSRA
jgi:osmotically-inducible protein OsmY